MSCCRNGPVAASVGSRPRRMRDSAGSPSSPAEMSGSRLSKRFSRSGDRRRSEASVGCRSSSTGSRSRISGSVLTENVRTRASVAFVSSRNVGRIRIESASASRRSDELAEELGVALHERRQRALVGGELLERAPGVLDEVAQRGAAVVEHVDDVLRVLGEHRQVAERVVEVAPAAGAGLRGARLPLPERLARRPRRRSRTARRTRPPRGPGRRAGARPPSGRARRGCPSSPRRTSRRAASSGAGSRARRPSSARTSRRARSSSAACRRPARAPS